MKKKGFTLIELLAVIIILAIVALIATPKILDIIEDSRRSAFEQSALGYYKAAEYIYNEMFLDGDTQDINFTFKDGVQTSSNPAYKLEVNGEKPKGGLIYLSKNGQMLVSIHNNKYCANVNYEGRVTISDDINTCLNGITEIPIECFTVVNEQLSSLNISNGYLDGSEEWMTKKYNMLDYDRTNSSCPTTIDAVILPSEIQGKQIEGIRQDAFNGIRNGVKLSMNNVIIPENVKVIDNNAFRQSGLKGSLLPNNLQYIGMWSFRDNQLTSIVIPNTVTFIDFAAFYQNKLTTINIPNSVTNVELIAFDGNQIKEVAVGNGMATVSNVYGDQVEKLTVGQDVGGNITVSFGGCPNLKELILGASVTAIGSGAFNNSSLTNLYIPGNVTSVGDAAFINSKIVNLTISNGVTSIGDDSFSTNQLTSLTIPNSVTSIGNAAFSTNQLTSLTIPDGVTSIGNAAFANNQLTSLTLPNSVTSIGNAAFSYNQLPDSQAFIYKRNSNGTVDTTTLISYGGAKRDNIVIPEGVQTIDENVFTDYTETLTNVTLPSTLKTIKYGAFMSVPLVNVVIPEGVETIEDEVFAYAYTISSLQLPSTLKTIGAYAFYGTVLERLAIPASVVTIGEEAFSDSMLSDASKITIQGNATRFDSIWETIGFPAK